MNRIILSIAATALALVASGAAAQTPRDSVVATVNEFFRAMTAHDSATLHRVQMADGVLYSARVYFRLPKVKGRKGVSAPP